MKRKCWALALLLSSCASYASYASIGINSMIEIAEKGEAQFTITNSAEYRQFITVSLSSVSTKEGELAFSPYSRDNIESWSLIPYPARTIINKGASKDFKFVYQAKEGESSERDKIYQASFVPAPYFPKGKPAQHSVQLVIGFSPYIIVPAEVDQPLNYELSYKKGVVEFENHGGSYIHVTLNACADELVKDKKASECVKVTRAISGRKLSIELPEASNKASSIQVELSTHNFTYKKSLLLKDGEVVKAEGE